MCVAWLCAGSIYLFLLYRTDWQHEADMAAERNAKAAQSAGKVVENTHTKGEEGNNNSVELEQVTPKDDPNDLAPVDLNAEDNSGD